MDEEFLKIWIYINNFLLEETSILFCIWKPVDSFEGYYYKEFLVPTFLFSNIQTIKPNSKIVLRTEWLCNKNT